jgi:hypothetical protein
VNNAGLRPVQTGYDRAQLHIRLFMYVGFIKKRLSFTSGRLTARFNVKAGKVERDDQIETTGHTVSHLRFKGSLRKT